MGQRQRGLTVMGKKGTAAVVLMFVLLMNLTVEVVNHATGHHGFDIEDDNDRSREIIRRTIEFIKTHGR